MKGHEITARIIKFVRKAILKGRKRGRGREEGRRRKRDWLMFNNSNQEPGRVVQWVKMVATKSGGMSLIPGTHKMEGEN